MSRKAEAITLIVGKRLREFRQAKGLSQEQLGELCGLHRTYVGALERGEKNVTVVTLSRIASAIGVPMRSFLE
ncbi:MAG: helix-turn-helix transcriptional regulator [Planctomycetes bacterium]|nr:helix-turn-helix transcriptional regulator [Planctomycetota bacterium]